jgi:hypothetical protein
VRLNQRCIAKLFFSIILLFPAIGFSTISDGEYACSGASQVSWSRDLFQECSIPSVGRVYPLVRQSFGVNNLRARLELKGNEIKMLVERLSASGWSKNVNFDLLFSETAKPFGGLFSQTPVQLRVGGGPSNTAVYDIDGNQLGYFFDTNHFSVSSNSRRFYSRACTPLVLADEIDVEPISDSKLSVTIVLLGIANDEATELHFVLDKQL